MLGNFLQIGGDERARCPLSISAIKIIPQKASIPLLHACGWCGAYLCAQTHTILGGPRKKHGAAVLQPHRRLPVFASAYFGPLAFLFGVWRVPDCQAIPDCPAVLRVADYHVLDQPVKQRGLRKRILYIKQYTVIMYCFIWKVSSFNWLFSALYEK